MKLRSDLTRDRQYAVADLDLAFKMYEAAELAFERARMVKEQAANNFERIDAQLTSGQFIDDAVSPL